MANHLVAVAGDLVESKRGRAAARGPDGFVNDLPWAQKRLGWDAGPVRAFTPDQLALYERGLESPRGGA